MNKNSIDPDYMHYKAMAALSKGAILEEQIRADKISAKELVTVERDFGSDIANLLPDIQRFMYGFVNGTNTI